MSSSGIPGLHSMLHLAFHCQHFMWQPDMLQVAEFLDAGVKRMQEIDPDAGSDSTQPGWLEQCNLLVLSCQPKVSSQDPGAGQALQQHA